MYSKYYGDEAVGYWLAYGEDEPIYPGYLKANEDDFVWKKAAKMRVLWPWLGGFPLHYSEE